MAVATEKQTTEPKYLKIAQYLRKRIEDGELKSGDRLPSFVEMRTDFGATPATVERVYADLERDDLIRREPNRGTFVAEPRPPHRTGLIGFVGNPSTSRREAYFTSIVGGIEEVIWREERRILLLDPNSSQGWDQVDGVLIYKPHAAAEWALRYLPRGLPCVTLMAAIDGYSSVLADDFEGIRSAMSHLLSLGHKRIAYLVEDGFPILRLRIAGYLDALRDAGIEEQWLRQPVASKDMDMDYRDWGRWSMNEWLNDGWLAQGCTAMLAQNDMVALGAMEALQAAGIDVPGQVSIVGYDNIDICDCVTPRLTSVEVPLHKIAAIGVEVLLRHIADRETEVSKIILPTKLCARDSTARLQ